LIRPQSLHDLCGDGHNSICGNRTDAHKHFFRASWEQNTFHGLIVGVGGDGGSIAVLDRVYFMRQIRTVLKFAQLTSDPRFAAFLIEKAEHLRSQIGETSTRDVGSLAPNVEPDK
jgi:hypothetical protein